MTDEQLAIAERAVFHELQALEDLLVAVAQESFRLPSGRPVTRKELDEAFGMRDKCRETLDAIRALREEKP
jgi:hypothetical protein